MVFGGNIDCFSPLWGARGVPPPPPPPPRAAAPSSRWDIAMEYLPEDDGDSDDGEADGEDAGGTA